jgi:4-hydroxybenzoate polyprenyltransferase
MWEARGQALEVALYVRAAVIAEGSKALASDRALVLRFMDDLGISSGGLAKNRWVIDRDIDDQPEVERPVPARGGSAKERLKLVVNT